MFYGVVQEEYVYEISVKEGIEKVKEFFKSILARIIKKAGELLEKAKKVKTSAVDGLKSLIAKAKALDAEIKDIKDQSDADKFKIKVDSASEALKKNQELMQEVIDKQDQIHGSVDDSLAKMNKKAEELNKAAKKK